MGLLQRHRNGLPQTHARFYAACILLVFEYFEGLHLIYRDLKPENILIAPDGYVKLADFGFIKKINRWERTHTICGTPEYMAPEVIMGLGHGTAADWYTLGILIYELSVGKPPFSHKDPYELFRQVLRRPIPFPEHLLGSTKALILGLCEHDPSKRLGNSESGAAKVKAHHYFSGIDFDQIYAKDLTAPYLPPENAIKVSSLRNGQLLESI